MAVHRVLFLVKRWLMGTMQGSVSPEQMQAYFNERVFRFNRRNSRSRGRGLVGDIAGADREVLINRLSETVPECPKIARSH